METASTEDCDMLTSLQEPNNVSRGTLNEWAFRELKFDKGFNSYIESARTELEFKQRKNWTLA